MYNLVGERFGKLVVKKANGKNKHNEQLWDCVCDCGNKTTVSTHSLMAGHTKSCGCLKKKSRQKHGEYQTRLYHVWNSMKQRCENPHKKSYIWYGAKGIRVCDEWRDFVGFKHWAMESGYNEDAKRGECTLDRIDINGNYEPSNCRWISMAEQNRNKSYHRYLEYQGDTYTITQLASKIGMNKDTLAYRLNAGWSLEDAINKPIKRKNCGSRMEK